LYSLHTLCPKIFDFVSDRSIQSARSYAAYSPFLI
jgi:hypothetical protein